MKKKSPLWDGLPPLIVAVIAVLAFVRGNWQLILLAGVFAVWGLWALKTMGIPVLRRKIGQNQTVSRRKVETQVKGDTVAETKRTAADTDPEVAQALLRHVNHRISSQLKESYPDIRWEWKTKNPVFLAVCGGIGRIRIYGVPDYEYADVELEQSGKLSCHLIQTLSAPSAAQPSQPPPPPSPPNQQEADPKEWYELHGRETLEALIAVLDSRGHSSLTVREDGSIVVQSMDGSGEDVQDTLFGFPPKDEWDNLVKVLEQTGLAAMARENSITVAW